MASSISTSQLSATDDMSKVTFLKNHSKNESNGDDDDDDDNTEMSSISTSTNGHSTPETTKSQSSNGKPTAKSAENISHSYSSGTFMKLKTYLHALRPWSLSASLVPTLMGSALAYRSQWATNFSFITFFLTIFTVVTVHCAGNVVNTYFDFIKGIDKQKADDRTLVDHILTKDEVSFEYKKKNN